MEPVEINAGTCYLRLLRADEHLDDRAALLEAFADPALRRFAPGYTVETREAAGDYVARRAREWEDDQRCAWAVAEPTTGALLGEVGLKGLDLDAGTAEVAVWLHPAARGRGIATAALGAALRYGFGALGLRQIDYVHHDDNTASRSLAQRCGFRQAGRDDGYLRWRRTADHTA
jgi:RimJ/RimL family protein N-acetyltransferase